MPTKVHLVKAMVFPVVMYEKAEQLSTKELMLLNCGVGEKLEKVLEKRTLESPLDCKEIKPPNPKGNQS